MPGLTIEAIDPKGTVSQDDAWNAVTARYTTNFDEATSIEAYLGEVTDDSMELVKQPMWVFVASGITFEGSRPIREDGTPVSREPYTVAYIYVYAITGEVLTVCLN
ncbi:MAG: hypothetical protein ABJC24_00340 [Chloroflexota bacterium]